MDPREHILTELFAALGRVSDVDLCERNRTFSISEDTPAALVLYDGDMPSSTDRPKAVPAGREPSFEMTLTPDIWGYVEGSSDDVGAARSALFWKVCRAVFRDRQFLSVLSQYDGGIALDGVSFSVPAKASSAAVGAFLVALTIPFRFAISDL